MKIVSVVFDYPTHSHKYSKMAKVWEYSIKKVMPDVTVELIKIDPPHWEVKKSYTSNTVKLDLWYKSLEATNENIIFMDCDMFVLGEMESAFDNDFDIGYTKRTKCRIPYNGGVVFCKNTNAAKDFILLWKEINYKMFKDPKFHRHWHDKYAGMNQSAFGYILEKCNFKAKLKEFPCKIYNACCEDWLGINQETTKAVHVKSRLRRDVFDSCMSQTRYRKAVTMWYRLAKEAEVLDEIPKSKLFYDFSKTPPAELYGYHRTDKRKRRRRPVRIKRLH